MSQRLTGQRLQRDAGGAVRLECSRALIPTYPLPPAESHPMFFGKRVYQGSSGRVYPLPIFTAVSDAPRGQAWEHWELSNGWVSVEVLPELGGRVHGSRHVPSGYELFYRQPVIKPALVGLAGPWLSGGVEFNWPQHHRPTTYMPADRVQEHHDDGSVTLWLGEHEAMDRMKALYGLRISPGSSRVELHARITNRTPLRQTFMWWANIAAEVHDHYQSFFPPDVTHVADHAVRAMSSFPVARNLYYGVDYRPGTDLTWYRNIPVPTSYMVIDSGYGFFGGYDHAADAGFVHVADRHVSPGKKQWTWGNSAFGWAWDRELTDARDDGRYPPYIELMAGVYTNNQPDFAYLEPHEAKTFTQCWWPIRRLGPVQQADRRSALRLVVDSGTIGYGVAVSEPARSATLRLEHEGRTLAEHTLDLEPSEGQRFELALPTGVEARKLTLWLKVGGEWWLRYQPSVPVDRPVPPPAQAPAPPAEVASNDQLYLIGEHLEQYRHPTRRPEPYWEEALRRDPSDARCRIALGRLLLRRGLDDAALEHLEAARARLTCWHPNPESGEVFYLLGLAQRRRGEHAAAEAHFGKAAWDRRYRAPAFYEMGRLFAQTSRDDEAVARLEEALAADPALADAQVLVAALLRHMGRAKEASARLDAVLRVDPLHFWAWWERGQNQVATGDKHAAQATAQAARAAMGDPSQTLLDVALDYAAAGLLEDAQHALRAVEEPTTPMIGYAQWWLAHRQGDASAAQAAAALALRTPRRGLFPVRHEEAQILSAASDALSADAEAPYLLGCLLYDRGRIAEAQAQWQRSIDRSPSHAGAHRNLGLVTHNARGDMPSAMKHFEQARRAQPDDARLLYELDQLRRRANHPPAERLRDLEACPELVGRRDDLTLERVQLLLLLGRDDEALSVLLGRRFHPWEGGEGKALGAYVAARLGAGVAAVTAGQPQKARAHFASALEAPGNLGEAFHPLAARADVHAHLGWACDQSGQADEARSWYEQAADMQRDFTDMAVQAFSPMTFYKGWSLRRLGREVEARRVFTGLRDHAVKQQTQAATIDYFATSLPNLLVFEDDLQRRHVLEHRFLEALALRGLGEHDRSDERLARLIADDPSHLGARQMSRWEHLR